MSNLDLWNQVAKTDPSYVKDAKIGQMKITAINPQYQRMKATEAFGPFGKGWGVSNASYTKHEFSNGTIILQYDANLWYKMEDNYCEFPITGTVKFAYMTSGGNGYLKVDDEATKKVSTDALTKGLSMLGFNADVFLGMWDDNKYVNQLKAEKKKEQAKKAPSIKDKALAAIQSCKTVDELAEKEKGFMEYSKKVEGFYDSVLQDHVKHKRAALGGK